MNNDRGGPPFASDETRRQLDKLLAVLSNQRRRDLLYHLLAVEVTDVETLAIEMSAEIESVSTTEVSNDIREQVQINLVHTDLPKLVEIGAIEFDRRTGDIRSRNFSPLLDQIVEACQDIEIDD
ncbi:DUF7344 domain-containing protein [Natronosalvus caseinilyticus]|uniref:DUF7344 domain-containing protein n=1 Tax=Natronosalvus caseinilyticus TaxID=2953747 RepID=UPI0028AEE809|nr:hypothetical protein [Natronosalvus caseinilyticus]